MASNYRRQRRLCAPETVNSRMNAFWRDIRRPPKPIDFDSHRDWRVWFFGEPIDSSFKFLIVWWFGGFGGLVGVPFCFFLGEGVWFGFLFFLVLLRFPMYIATVDFSVGTSLDPILKNVEWYTWASRSSCRQACFISMIDIERITFNREWVWFCNLRIRMPLQPEQNVNLLRRLLHSMESVESSGPLVHPGAYWRVLEHPSA